MGFTPEVDFFEGAGTELEVAPEIGGVEEPAGDLEHEAEMEPGVRGQISAFKEDGRAGDVRKRVAARAGAPIDDQGAARGEEDIAGMKVPVAQGVAVAQLGEDATGGLLPGFREVRPGVVDPAGDLVALGRKFERNGGGMELRVKFGSEAGGGEEGPWAGLNLLQEGTATEPLEHNSPAAVELNDFVGRGRGQASGVNRTGDGELALDAGGGHEIKAELEDAIVSPGKEVRRAAAGDEGFGRGHGRTVEFSGAPHRERIIVSVTGREQATERGWALRYLATMCLMGT